MTDISSHHITRCIFITVAAAILNSHGWRALQMVGNMDEKKQRILTFVVFDMSIRTAQISLSG
jgi:hypothetical protein